MAGSHSASEVLVVASRVWVEERIVRQDYGQFSLSGFYDQEEVPEFDEMDVLHAALEGDGIAQHGDYLVILSPHQTNFEMPLAIEVWDEQPAGEEADEVEWPEAFEADLNIGLTGSLCYSSPTMDAVAVQYASLTPDGRRCYRLDVQHPAGASIRADVFGPN